MITRKNFFPAVCVIFTCFSVVKILIENVILKAPDSHYAENFITALVLCFVVIGLFALAPRLSNFPLWSVQLIGYAGIAAALVFCVWIEHLFVELSTSAYRDSFLSFTICYIPVAVIYHIKMYHDVKKANKDLGKIQELVKREKY